MAEQFRKKPVVIEAFQWMGQTTELPEWTAFKLTYHETEKIHNSGYLLIDTLQGEMRAAPGDFIIKGIKGEIYPCKPDIFAATYDRVDEKTDEGYRMSLSETAKTAYLAYGKSTGGKNYQGNPMPAFEDLPPAIKIAWEAAVIAVGAMRHQYPGSFDIVKGKTVAIDFGLPNVSEGAGVISTHIVEKPTGRELHDHKVTAMNLKHVQVYAIDEPGAGGGNHQYLIAVIEPAETSDNRDRLLSSLLIEFQNGPLQEAGVNGITDQALLAVVLDRWRGFQSGEYSCRENALAITKLEEALLWNLKRAHDRQVRGVEGTHQK